MFDPSHYLGVDPDAKRIDYAKRLYPRHTFEVLQGNDLPVDNQSVDYILIVSVLHHIPTQELTNYVTEFQRILKPTGTIVVMEPCLCKKKPICSWFMKWFDKGEYIRDEQEYLQLFQGKDFDCRIIRRFRKCLLYHELFFSVQPQANSIG